MTDELPIWQQPALGGHPDRGVLGLSHLERQRMWREGRLPYSPLSYLTELDFTEASKGHAAFTVPASPWFANSAGLIPGGMLAPAADAALGASVGTELGPGVLFTTAELSLTLQIIVNPTVAYLLLLVGLIGLAIEIFSPGAILPGVLGAISLLLGAYGTAQLPVTAAGIALLVVAVGLFVAEGHLNSHGVLGAGGVVALIFSGLLLFNGGDGAHVSIVIVVVVGLLLGGFLVFLVQRSLRARRLPKRSGSEEMQGRSAQVRSALDPEGQVYVNGALWRARLANGDGPVRVGDRVRVEAVESLTLIVRPEPEPPEPIEEGATQWQ
jgi:membrane protein implicated in regulation of membrane protease activity